jgi:hypothetical protein
MNKKSDEDIDFEFIVELQIENLQNTYHEFDEQLIDAAYREMPLTKNAGRASLRYRLAVAQQFLSLRGNPPKRKDGNRFRSEEESRLDRAFTQAAEAYDRCESTVRNLCVHRMYSGDDATVQFRSDLLAIEERLQP